MHFVKTVDRIVGPYEGCVLVHLFFNVQLKVFLNGTRTRSGCTKTAAGRTIRYQEILIHSAPGMRINEDSRDECFQMHTASGTTSRSYPTLAMHFDGCQAMRCYLVASSASTSMPSALSAAMSSAIRACILTSVLALADEPEAPTVRSFAACARRFAALTSSKDA